MSYFVFQSSVLLLGAYFLGASFGCMFRSLMFDSREASSVRAGGSEEAAVVPANVEPHVSPAPQEAPASHAAPAPQEPPVSQQAPASQEAAQVAALVAKTGVSSDSVAGSAAAMAAATVAAATAQSATPAAPQASMPEGGTMASSAADAAVSAAQNHADADQAGNASEPAPVAEPAPDMEVPKITLPTSAALATAAAAAATATASSGTNEVATSGTTSATGSATAPAAPVASGGADDLKRIQGIGPEVEAVLHSNGITEYRQIANWSAADIERFSVDLNFSDRVSRENWIEQAQILATGGTTKYSDRIDRGEIAVENISDKDDGSDGNGGPTSGATGAGPSGGATGGPTGGATSSGATGPTSGSLGMSAALGVVAAATGGSSTLSLSSGTEATAEPSIAASAAAASMLMASNGSAKALPSILESAQAIRIPGDASGPVDDLKLIKGIGLGLEEKLNGAGVTSFGQIAAWSASDIDEMSKLLSFQGRIERENWVEQAQILGAGGQTDFSKRVERGEVQSSLNGAA